MTTVTVTGMGGCIRNEIFLIADTLRKAGYDVSIDDAEYPAEQYDDPEDIERTRERCVLFNSGQLSEGQTSTHRRLRVVIKANHLPWGG